MTVTITYTKNLTVPLRCQYKKHHKLINFGLKLVGGAIATAIICAGTVGVGCVVLAGALYGGTYSGVRYAVRHKKASGAGFIGATLGGAAWGGIQPFGISTLTSGHAHSWWHVAKRVLNFTFRGQRHYE